MINIANIANITASDHIIKNNLISLANKFLICLECMKRDNNAPLKINKCMPSRSVRTKLIEINLVS